jgi:hypothetical protein
LIDVTALRRNHAARADIAVHLVHCLHPADRSSVEDVCRQAALPSPSVNSWVAGQEVDMLWSEQRLVVELDGRSFHQTRAAFERDRLRDAALQLAGYRVLRITRRRLETEPATVVAAVRDLLSSSDRVWPTPD